MNFSVIEPYAPMFWGGLAVTLEVTGAALVLAFALGAVIAVLKVLPCRPLRLLLDFYTSLFRGIPLIVLLFIVYFATPSSRATRSRCSPQACSRWDSTARPRCQRPCAAASRGSTGASTTRATRWACPTSR